jgi:hypothetical protein
MEKTTPKKIPFLTPCLPLEASEKEDKKEESEYVTFTLKKVRAGTGSTAPSYKMKVAKFEDGTPAEWIDVLDALEEIWKQNSMVTATDREKQASRPFYEKMPWLLLSQVLTTAEHKMRMLTTMHQTSYSTMQ